MIVSLRHLLGWIFRVVRTRENLILENLALRQQLLALHAKRPQRRLSALHKLFSVMLSKLWSGWRNPLILVTREPSPIGIVPAFGCIGYMGFQSQASSAWQRYSFVDAFNPLTGWYDTDALGIDLGIVTLMAENYRTAFVWNTFMADGQ